MLNKDAGVQSATSQNKVLFKTFPKFLRTGFKQHVSEAAAELKYWNSYF